MREVSYVDEWGRKWATLIPDDAPDSDAKSGLPLGPISLESFDLPLDMEVRLHNALFEHRLLTLADLRKPGGMDSLGSAVRSVYKFSAHQILDLYREESNASG